MKSIRQQIIDIASEAFGVPVADLNPGATWSIRNAATNEMRSAQPLPDSLDVVELVMAVEEHFDVELPDAEVAGMKCLDDLIRAVERQLGDDDPGVPVAIKPRLPRGRPSIRNPLT